MSEHPHKWHCYTDYPNAGQIIDDYGVAHMTTCSGITSMFEPEWATEAGQKTYDGTVIWICLAPPKQQILPQIDVNNISIEEREV